MLYQLNTFILIPSFNQVVVLFLTIPLYSFTLVKSRKVTNKFALYKGKITVSQSRSFSRLKGAGVKSRGIRLPKARQPLTERHGTRYPYEGAGQKDCPLWQTPSADRERQTIFDGAGKGERNPPTMSQRFLCPCGLFPEKREQKNPFSARAWQEGCPAIGRGSRVKLLACGSGNRAANPWERKRNYFFTDFSAKIFNFLLQGKAKYTLRESLNL